MADTSTLTPASFDAPINLVVDVAELRVVRYGDDVVLYLTDVAGSPVTVRLNASGQDATMAAILRTAACAATGCKAVPA